MTNPWGTSDDVWMNVATMLGFALIALGIVLVIAINSPDRTVFGMVIFGWSGINSMS